MVGHVVVEPYLHHPAVRGPDERRAALDTICDVDGQHGVHRAGIGRTAEDAERPEIAGPQPVRECPQERGWLRDACRTARRAGLADSFRGFFEKQQVLSPRDVRWAVAVREVRLQFGDLPGAIEAARAAVAVRPERESLWREAADLLVRADRPRDAAVLLEGWAKPRPADEEAARRRSELLARIGEGDKALAVERGALDAYAKDGFEALWRQVWVIEVSASLAREAGELAMESSILNRLAILAAQQSFDLATAKRLLEEAWCVAEASGDPEILAETEWNLAQMAIHACKLKRALIHAERALERAHVTGLKELRARSLYTLGLSYALGGCWEEVMTSVEEARTLYAAINDQAGEASGLSAQLIYAGSPPSEQLTKRAMEVLCLCLLALGHVNCGEPRAGVSAGQAALDISLEIKNIWAQVYSVLNLNHALLEVGEYGQALRVTQQGVEMARTLPNPTLLFFLLTVLGAVHQAMLSLEEAQAALREALALSETIVVRSYHVLATSRLCANSALAGDWKSAYTYALEAVAVRKDIETSLPFIDFLRYFEIEALLRGGEEGRAREEVQRLGEGSRTTRRQRLPYLRALATLAEFDGETREALASLQEAAVLAHEIGLPGELWQIEVALGEVYASSGQREQAHQAFARAMAIVQKLAAKMEDEARRSNFLAEPVVRRVLEPGRA